MTEKMRLTFSVAYKLILKTPLNDTHYDHLPLLFAHLGSLLYGHNS